MTVQTLKNSDSVHDLGKRYCASVCHCLSSPYASNYQTRRVLCEERWTEKKASKCNHNI